jgi:hypothetical protein
VKKIASITIAIALLVGYQAELFAQWSGDSTVNTAISVATGNQSTPSAFSDGAGGALITWTDARSGNNDAYAQLVNASGVVQWATDGVIVSATTGDQNNPMAVSDGSGGYILAWWDTRGASYDIYTQRINSSGVSQWAANGIPICTAAGNQIFPMIVSDGSGGAIITWDDSRSGSSDVYAQRINGNGDTLWTANGVPVCTATGNQTSPIIIGDGSGGAIIAWTDARGINNDIYAQRINATGDTLWTADGVVITAATNSQMNPAMVADGSGGAILVWQDRRDSGTNGWDIYSQRVDASGVVQWTADGIPISTSADDQTIPVLVSDGSGGAIIAWSDFRSGTNADIYAQRVISSGSKQWISTGVGVVTLSSNQSSPVIASDSAGGAIIAWNDGRNSNITDIYAQRLNGSGNALWQANGVAICTATGYQDLGVANNRNIRPMVSDGSGGAIVVWSDPRSGAGTDVYAQWMGSTSVLPVEMFSFSASVRGSTVNVRWTTATEVNNYGFEVERKAISGQLSAVSAWIEIGFVAAAGASNGPHEYSFTDQSLSAGVYTYRLKQVDKNGSFKYSNSSEVEVGVTPKEFTLGQNYPNPFNPSTTLEFTLATDGRAVVKVYDVLGQEVAIVFDQQAEAGRVYEANFDGRRLPSGVYVSVLESGGKRLLRKMLLVK